MRGAAPWLMGAALLVGSAACIPEAELRPLPPARTLAKDETAAMVEESGVRLLADGDAWRGSPSDLEQSLTPVAVRLENHSGRPLSVKYEHFELVGGSRFHYAAVPPMSLSGALSRLEPASGTGGAGVGLGVQSGGWWGLGLGWGWSWGWNRPYAWGPGPGWYDPIWGPYYPGPGLGWYDPFWGPYYPGPYGYYREPLPTRDMLSNALPEGTLEEGGMTTGFLYFQGVAHREDVVTLQARLVDARTHETFGALEIPFQVTH